VSLVCGSAVHFLSCRDAGNLEVEVALEPPFKFLSLPIPCGSYDGFFAADLSFFSGIFWPPFRPFFLKKKTRGGSARDSRTRAVFGRRQPRASVARARLVARARFLRAGGARAPSPFKTELKV
jgi:hypothetical protein